MISYAYVCFTFLYLSILCNLIYYRHNIYNKMLWGASLQLVLTNYELRWMNKRWDFTTCNPSAPSSRGKMKKLSAKTSSNHDIT